MEDIQSMGEETMAKVTEECPAPRELTLMEHAADWYNSLSEEDADRFIGGVSLEAVLVLFKSFPDNDVIKSLLHSKL